MRLSPQQLASWREDGYVTYDAEPLLTLITIPEEVPTLALVGVPLRLPVPVLNFPHEGRLAMEKTMAPAPEGSEALGWNV